MEKEPIYQILEHPVYDTEIRRLQNSDPASAEGIFNPLFSQIINNIHAVKLENEEKMNADFSNMIPGILEYVLGDIDCGYFKEQPVQTMTGTFKVGEYKVGQPTREGKA